MGIMSYSLNGSDTAADMASDIFDMMAKKLHRSIRHKDNEYNTSGPMNVAFFIDEFLSKNTKLVGSFARDQFAVLGKMALEGVMSQLEELKAMDRGEQRKYKSLNKSLRKLKVSLNKFIRKMSKKK